MLLLLHFCPECHIVLKLIIYLDLSEASKCPLIQEAATTVSALLDIFMIKGGILICLTDSFRAFMEMDIIVVFYGSFVFSPLFLSAELGL